MRIVARRTLREFVDTRTGRKGYSAVKAAVESWHHEVQQATWKSIADLKRHYATASPITSDRVVFNIKGSDYRLVAAIDFEKAIVWIKWISSHADYDKIDVKKVQHGT